MLSCVESKCNAHAHYIYQSLPQFLNWFAKELLGSLHREEEESWDDGKRRNLEESWDDGKRRFGVCVGSICYIVVSHY